MPRRPKQNGLLFIAFVMVTVNPAIAVAEENAPPGQANFEDYCAACHGYDGIPVLPGTPNFSIGERLNKKDNELLQAINIGKGDVMPPWEGVLNEKAQQDVLDYIKNVLQQKKTDKN